ncbi:hypothetical protein D5S17_36010 [Pseudonocardiaceae bacterium YIM PH 21723]|nr:hypothetical protein D5S17_36010 [Pseudonocardiaceae bacterium YIM PH 21723]
MTGSHLMSGPRELVRPGHIGTVTAGFSGPAATELARPMQLFPPVPWMVDRHDELEQLLHWRAQPELARIEISGPEGIGKTALAATFLRRARFTDGVLRLDLDATGHSGPLDSAAELACLLGALGVDERRIPGRAQHIRNLWAEVTGPLSLCLVIRVHGKTTDAAECISELLPSSTSGAILVLSRTYTQALRRYGFVSLRLPALPREEAAALLHRAAGEPPQLSLNECGQMARALACHPLSLVIAGSVLSRARTPEAIATLLPLSRKTAKDVMTATITRAINELTDDGLTVLKAGAFQVGRTFQIPVLCALTGLPVERVTQAVLEIGDAHMLSEHGDDAASPHDESWFVRDDASGCLRVITSPAECDAITEASVQHYLHMFCAAGATLIPHRWTVGKLTQRLRALPPQAPAFCRCLPPGAHAKDCVRKPAARHWFESHLDVLFTTFYWLLEQQRSDEAWQLIEGASACFIRAPRTLTRKWIDLLEAAIVAAEKLDAPLPAWRMRTQLVTALQRAGEHLRAMRLARENHHHAEDMPDVQALLVSLGHMAKCLLTLGHREEAYQYSARKVSCSRQAYSTDSELRRDLRLALRRHARICVLTGRIQEAEQALAEALTLCKDADPDDVAELHRGRSVLLRRIGVPAGALRAAQAAEAISEATGGYPDHLGNAQIQAGLSYIALALASITDPDSPQARLCRAVAGLEARLREQEPAA